MSVPKKTELDKPETGTTLLTRGIAKYESPEFSVATVPVHTVSSSQNDSGKSEAETEVLEKSDTKSRKRTPPPPEERVRGSGGVSFFSQLNTTVKTPDWADFWRHMRWVRLWQACVLSLNIDPDSMEPDFMSDYDYGGEENFPDSATKVIFDKRLRLLIEYLPDRSYFSPGTWNMYSPNLHEVKLNEFAVWGLSLEWELPPELKTMASQKGSQVEQERLASREGEMSVDDHLTPHPNLPADAIKSKRSLSDKEARQLSTSKRPDWAESAREIAKVCIDKHKLDDLYPSQNDVCAHVEEEMRKQKIFGTHGNPLDAKYIQRNAIQGEWWQKNKNKR